MKIFFLIMLFTSQLYAVEIGNDIVGGKISIEISDGPLIFTTTVTTTKSAAPSTTDPFLILSAFQVCHPNGFVPRLLDLKYSQRGAGYVVKRTFKCVNGATEDWKRVVRIQCENSSNGRDDAMLNYCNFLGAKFGEDIVKCSGPCNGTR